MRHSLQLIPLVVALVTALAGCTDEATGVAVPSGTTPQPSAGTGGPFTTTPGGSHASGQSTVPRSPLADVAPCSLLTAAEAAELQAGPGKQEQVNNARACNFNEAKGFVVGVAIYDELGLADVVAQGTPKLLTVGKRKAAQFMGGIDTCAVSIEMTKTSRVDAQGTAQGNEAKSCEIALRVANLIEPKLPPS